MKLPGGWSLPDTIVQRFGDNFGKQRAMVADGHLLLILHKLPQWGERKRKAVLFWRAPNGDWQTTLGGKGLPALQQHLKSYEKAEIAFDERYDQAGTAEEYFRLLEELAPVLHAAQNLYATLQSAREAVTSDKNLIAHRDAAANLTRNLELIHQSARNGLDFEIARQAESQARLSEESIRIANRLNIIAAIFLPLTAVAGLFGMNLPSGLSQESPVIFWVILVAAFVLGFALKGWVTSDTKT